MVSARMAQVALRRAVSLNPSSPGGLGASWVISWMTAGKRGRGSRSDSDEGQYPSQEGRVLGLPRPHDEPCSHSAKRPQESGGEPGAENSRSDSDRVQQRPRQRHPSIQRSVVCPGNLGPGDG